MSDTTILYLTDNSLSPAFMETCQKHLLKAAAGKRIVTVSQRPLEFGDNICIGDIGRSGFSIERQLEAGLKEVQTRFVALAEHDCLYPVEHFDFIPLNDGEFFYNTNCWFLNAKTGVFSYTPNRYAQSQLIANTARMREATERKMAILSDPVIRRLYPTRSRICEPGVDVFTRYWRIRMKRIFKNQIGHLRASVMDYMTRYVAKSFQTAVPTIDVRHNGNFTGFRAGRGRRLSLEPWGTIGDIFNGALNGAS